MKPLSEAEIDYARRLARMQRDDQDPAKGIVIGMLIGGAIWLVLATIIYFTFFCK